MRWRTMLAAFAGLAFSSLSFTAGTVDAEAAWNVKLIYRGPTVSNISWSHDGHYLAFSDATIPTVEMYDELSSWYRFDTQLNQLEQTTTYPFQTSLSSEEEQSFAPANDEGLSLIFSSPNERYIVYAGSLVPVYADQDKERAIGFYFNLMLGDRLTLHATSIDDPVYWPFSGTEQFNVVWSEDGRAFITNHANVMVDYAAVVGGYVSNYTQDVMRATLMFSPRHQLLNGLIHEGHEAYDISNDNRLVIVRTSSTGDTAVPSYHLLVQDVTNPVNFQEIPVPDAFKILDAEFVMSSSDIMLIVDDRQIIQYTLSTATAQGIELHTPSIVNFHDASISPNGKHIAFVDEAGNLYLASRFLDVQTEQTSFSDIEREVFEIVVPTLGYPEDLTSNEVKRRISQAWSLDNQRVLLETSNDDLPSSS
jgi:dipeptidyl aminopeptidase/acylaminoacyl peptidase